MAVPKKRMSKRRTRKRRAVHMRMDAPNVTLCPKCSEPKLPHRVCPSCGFYKGREVVHIPEE
jgi:large subunit ribosomal protein L32